MSKDYEAIININVELSANGTFARLYRQSHKGRFDVGVLSTNANGENVFQASPNLLLDARTQRTILTITERVTLNKAPSHEH